MQDYGAATSGDRSAAVDHVMLDAPRVHLPPSLEDASAAVSSSREIAVRRATPGEADEIAGVWWRSRAASVPRIPPPTHSEPEVRAWFSDVVLPGREVWVAEAAGPLIVALLVLDGEHLDQLYVDPGWTGLRIGTSLLGVAKARRPEGFDLWTFQSNEGAQRFYRRHGLRVAGATSGDNEEGAPDVSFVWSGPGGR